MTELCNLSFSFSIILAVALLCFLFTCQFFISCSSIAVFKTPWVRISSFHTAFSQIKFLFIYLFTFVLNFFFLYCWYTLMLLVQVMCYLFFQMHNASHEILLFRCTRRIFGMHPFRLNTFLLPVIAFYHRIYRVL